MRALRSAADPGGSLRDSSVGCDWCCAEAAPAASSAAIRNGIEWMNLMLASIKLLQLLADVACGDGEVWAVARDDLLPFAAEDEAEELAHFRIQRAAWRLVDVDVGVARQRVAPICDVVGGERNGGAIRRARHRDDFEIWIARALRAVGVHASAIDVHQGTPADSVLVLLQRLVHPLARDGAAVRVAGGLLHLHVFAEIGIPFVRPVHHHPLEADGESRGHVAVGLDLSAGIVALEAELVPGADVAVAATGIFCGEEQVVRSLCADLPAAGALGAEDAIELVYGQPGQRIGLVDDDRPGEERTALVVAAGGD